MTLGASSAWAASANSSVTNGTVNGGRAGGVAVPDMNDPGLSSAELVGSIPALFFSISSLAIGPSKLTKLKPWLPPIGAASGAVVLVCGIAHGIVNQNHPGVAIPYTALGVAVGVPTLALASYGWIMNAPPPKGTVQVLSGNEITLAPPTPTLMTTPNGATGIGVSLLSGRF